MDRYIGKNQSSRSTIPRESGAEYKELNMTNKTNKPPGYVRPTATTYMKGFIEDDPTMDAITRRIEHTSNLILNLEQMEKEERQKAAVDIIEGSIIAAEAMLDDTSTTEWKKDNDPRINRLEAADFVASALNTLHHAKRGYRPTFTNPKIEAAWNKKNIRLLLEPGDEPRKEKK